MNKWKQVDLDCLPTNFTKEDVYEFRMYNPEGLAHGWLTPSGVLLDVINGLDRYYRKKQKYVYTHHIVIHSWWRREKGKDWFKVSMYSPENKTYTVHTNCVVTNKFIVQHFKREDFNDFEVAVTPPEEA